MARRSAMSPVRKTSGRSSATGERARPRADSRQFGQADSTSSSVNRANASSLRRPINESLRERSQRRALCARRPLGAKQLRIGREQLGRRRQMTSEARLESGDDRTRRRDGELLAHDLEDQRRRSASSGGSSSIQAGGGSPVARRSAPRGPDRRRGGNSRALRVASAARSGSVSVTLILSEPVGQHDLDHVGDGFFAGPVALESTARATQVTGCPPAWTTRWRAMRWASSLVPPVASTTG